MANRQGFWGSLIALVLLLFLVCLVPPAGISALQPDTPTPTPTATGRPQALRRTVLANSIRGLALNVPYDSNSPPCQSADFGVGAWHQLQPVSGAASVSTFARDSRVMVRITDSFFPAICSTDPISNAYATNLSTNQTIPALVWDYNPLDVISGTSFYEGSASRFYVAQLPLDAYTQPGDWVLGIGAPQAISLTVGVGASQQPAGLLDGNGSYWIAGFQPNENVVGLIFNDVGDEAGNVTAEVKDDFEFAVNGAGVGRVTSQPYWNMTQPNLTVGLMLLVGDRGTSLYYPLGEFGTSIFTTDGSRSPADANGDSAITDQELADYIRANYFAAAAPAPVSACPADLPPRLVVGQRGRVTPGTANNLRANPSRNAERLGQIPGSGEFDVLAGPECSGGFTWWQVRYGGQIGWTAEGSGGVYWLEPVAGGSGSSTSPSVVFTRDLRLTSPRMTGDDVIAVQARLTDLGYDSGSIDGIYGPITEGAVRQYQSDHGLTVDGIVGPITWSRLFT